MKCLHMDIRYSTPIRTSAVRAVEHAVIDVSYKFWYQIIATFQSSVVIILAFQFNDIITKMIEFKDIEVRYAFVIPVLVILSIAASYIKDKYSHFYHFNNVVSTSGGVPTHYFAH